MTATRRIGWYSRRWLRLVGYFSGIGQLDVEDAEDGGKDNNEHDLEWQSEVSKHFYLTTAGLNAIYRAMTGKMR